MISGGHRAREGLHVRAAQAEPDVGAVMAQSAFVLEQVEDEEEHSPEEPSGVGMPSQLGTEAERWTWVVLRHWDRGLGLPVV
jgi:hypothetical protein